MTKRYDETNEVLIFKYDLFRALDWGKDLDEELERQTALWNRLCEIERKYVAAVRAVANPAVEEINQEIEPLVDQLNKLVEERRAMRKAAQKKLPTPELDETINSLKVRTKELRQTAKKLRKDAYEANKDKLKELNSQRYTDVAEARRNSGLYWGSYNSIVNSYEIARVRALKEGRELKSQNHNGEGRFTNQIQGGITAAKIMSGTNGQVAITGKPEWIWVWDRKKSRWEKRKMNNKQGMTLTIRAYTSPGEGNKRTSRTVSFPFVMYRPLPEDCLVKEVDIIRRRSTLGYTYHAIFTLTRPHDPTCTATGLPRSINLGWRKTQEGIRVGTAVTWDDQNEFGEPIHCELPANIIDGFETYETVQSVRDTARNEISAKLKVIQPDAVPSQLLDLWLELHNRKTTKTGLLLAIYDTWRNNCVAWNYELFDQLAVWHHGTGRQSIPDWKARMGLPEARFQLSGERGLAKEQVYRRRWITNARLYFYRAEAHRLIGDAIMVVMNEHNMADTARRDRALPTPARRQRFLASPSLLRQAILNYCKKRNIEVRSFKSEGLIHWRCGNEVHTETPDELRQLCPHCVEWFDIDENFCKVMLRRTAMPTLPRKAA